MTCFFNLLPFAFNLLPLLKLLYLFLLTQNIIDIVISVRHTSFFVRIYLEGFLFAGGYNTDYLFYQVNFHLCVMICKYRVEKFLQEFVAYLYWQQAVIQGVTFKNIGEKAAHHHVETVIGNGPGRMLATAAATEIPACNQYFSAIGWVVQHEILFWIVVLIKPPV